MKKPVYIFCSDLHYRSNQPSSRQDVNWLQSTYNDTQFLIDTQNELQCPLIIAGDIWDKWWGEIRSYNLFNGLSDIFSRSLFPIYSIAGNHDLPNHVISEQHRSAYQAFIERNTRIEDITNTHNGEVVDGKRFTIHGLPFNYDTIPNITKSDYNIAVIHKLVWETEPYIGASKSGNVSAIRKEFSEFDLVVAGDNHIGFCNTESKPHIVNCGSMRCDTIAQIGYRPRMCVLYSDLSIEPIYYPQDGVVLAESVAVALNKRQKRMAKFTEAINNRKHEKKDLTNVINGLIVETVPEVQAIVTNIKERSN